ncbi:uncharacterized protein F4807DRAFT_442118 [Annulohypoxylon truncatum]|uniref:uncharacterized protein n=1 Tax=Annulohypoxylon truncatum TaxID=327061 RepID=UPI002007BDD8|nr:uncharacterized protein F4807DRAFT_442118 [Annulohypoxylon truncatum]KAI1205743.1 hypothetical protein F4807DRAFT_442118 [Annulohypoxylon truncatum]
MRPTTRRKLFQSRMNASSCRLLLIPTTYIPRYICKYPILSIIHKIRDNLLQGSYTKLIDLGILYLTRIPIGFNVYFYTGLT